MFAPPWSGVPASFVFYSFFRSLSWPSLCSLYLVLDGSAESAIWPGFCWLALFWGGRVRSQEGECCERAPSCLMKADANQRAFYATRKEGRVAELCLFLRCTAFFRFSDTLNHTSLFGIFFLNYRGVK